MVRISGKRVKCIPEAELLRELVKEITAYPGGAIHIAWNFKDFISGDEKTSEL